MTEYRATGTANDLAYVLANTDAPDLTYADRLNAFASMLITEVNDAFGADVFSGTDATDIELDSGFALDPDLDADLALSVAALQENKFDELGGSTFSGYLSSIQQQLGLMNRTLPPRVPFMKASACSSKTNSNRYREFLSMKNWLIFSDCSRSIRRQPKSCSTRPP